MVETDVKNKTVMVGLPTLLKVDLVTATNVIWCGPTPESQFECLAQVRAHGERLKAKAFHKDGNLTVEFIDSLQGLAPGQTIALYENERVIGSGTVVSTARN